ncbi:glycosyltransferase family 2 protein [Sediminitomix flava]|uniref:Cellulose synthase/poly-beta-1,6-N-acetylglucosamine synthase-like glycosyltransferase n=1 Tax=Sediminitomix flava TaxID=379075 RepID=A0A315Z4V4_SEDFL|nr:glycosyltransferase family 2 protein [Sediminitomix flava]PWJ38518.1 cellulose synthase/poly-beta-1,6-N-acetylglucosamine synthase-like glycosyltransferase [Sediminitomix flava]
MEFLFWLSIVIVIYAFVGYGVILYGLVKLKNFLFPRSVKYNEDYYPEVTFVVAAYNEEDCIEEKILNSLSLDYPKDKIKYLFVTDGSTDRTNEIIKNYEEVTLEFSPERKGKIAAVNRIMKLIESPIVIFSDANTTLNKEAILNIVRHFQYPTVGAVAGEKRIIQAEEGDASNAGEGIYWKYESKLKELDSELYSTMGAAGELFAIRNDLYTEMESDALIEDFLMTMRIAAQGYKVVYEKEATASETSSMNIKEEFKRKVRISAGGIQAVIRLVPLLNFFKFGILTFQYISHRAIRWTLSPLALPIILITNSLLHFEVGGFYSFLWYAQVTFYLLAGLGWVFEKRKIRSKILFMPFYFIMMNYSVFLGYFRLVKGSQSVVWDKAKRATTV